MTDREIQEIKQLAEDTVAKTTALSDRVKALEEDMVARTDALSYRVKALEEMVARANALSNQVQTEEYRVTYYRRGGD